MSCYQMPIGNKVIFTYKLHIHISICANISYLSCSLSFCAIHAFIHSLLPIVHLLFTVLCSIGNMCMYVYR